MQYSNTLSVCIYVVVYNVLELYDEALYMFGEFLNFIQENGEVLFLSYNVMSSET